MGEGVIIDCGREEGGQHPLDDDDYWLDLYVMLSRATRLDDLLLLRAPSLEFLSHGPPSTLKEQLRKFTTRTDKLRLQAAVFARELGLEKLIPAE